MVEYVCETCMKVFKQKSHFNKHKERKTPCKKDVALDALIEKKVKEILAGAAAVVAVAPVEPAVPLIVKPVLKWVGGKTQILEQVLDRFPKEMVNYHEPFLGGGSVLLATLSDIRVGKIRLTGKVLASDLNANLVGLYKNIQSRPAELIGELKKLVEEFSKCKSAEVNRAAITLEEALSSQESYYFWIRSKFNSMTAAERQTCPGSAMLLFMNKTCFRGVYREGPRGFNVPFGNYASPGIFEESHIHDVSTLIKDVVFVSQPFQKALAGVSAGDFVYLDPPYAPETDKSFVGYTAGGFSEEEHRALFKRCHEIVAGGASFLLSNASVKMVKEAFPEPAFETTIVTCRRAINSKKPDATTKEVLIRPAALAAPTDKTLS